MTTAREVTLEDLEQMQASALLLPVEVAGLFRVDLKTVTRWAKARNLASVRTVGGHRRFRAGDVLRKLKEPGDAATVPAEGA